MSATLPHNGRPWMNAVESQLAAISIINRVTHKLNDEHVRNQFELDRLLLKGSFPYSWSEQVIDAVSLASESIPGETKLDQWNLNTPNVWWHFEKTLPYQTTNIGTGEGYIHALSMGWLNATHFSISGWIADPMKEFLVTPSQAWHWRRGETLDEMLARIRVEHLALYGPGGKMEHAPQVGIDVFMRAAEAISRFILAGLVWLTQRVVIPTVEPIERHRRKELERLNQRSYDGVRVVQLRRSEHRESTEPSGERREYAFRFLVQGHWRLQPCGPQHSERRLTYVIPYIKGPEDKELKLPTKTVYLVNR